MLVLETGVGMPDADALISVAEARAYALSMGLALPVVDTDVEVLIRRCNAWLMAMEPKMQGWRRNPDQALVFPRVGVSLAGRAQVIGYTLVAFYLNEGVVPPQLKQGLCQLVLELQTLDALPTVADPRIVVAEQVGPLSTTYAHSGTNSANPEFPKVMAYIAPFFRQGGVLHSERA